MGAEGVTVCASCRSANPPGYRFCVTCGAALGRPAAAPSGEGLVVRRATPPAELSTTPAPPVALAPEPPVPPAGALPTPFSPAPSPPPPPVPEPASVPIPLGPPLNVPLAAPVPVTPMADSALPSTEPGDGDKIIGAPVVSIAAARPAPKLIRCARCHGHSAEGMRFCKYCGAPLDEAAPRAEIVEAREAVEVGGTGAEIGPPERGGPGRAGVTPRPPAGPTGMRTGERISSPGLAPPVAGRAPMGRLVVIVEDGSEGKAFPLIDRQVDIGRVEGDIILADDLYVSPRHARFLPQGGQWILRDLHSTNGVYVRIREPHPLKDADLLLLGLEVLQFETVNDAERGLGHASQHGTLLFGSPSTPRRARLCQRTVEGVIRDVYHLFRDETVIGREVGDIVFTADPFLSRRHAVVRRNAHTGEFSIVDLDSSNGTYVAIRNDVTLADGDFLRIGQHLFRVDLA
jgi:pSer/pThr/pTyr-binding forkhead associated (FHA) protein